MQENTGLLLSIDSNKQFVKRHVYEFGRRIRTFGYEAKLLTAAICLCLLFNSGCTNTSNVADQVALESGFNRRLVAGARFEHVVYESNLHNSEAGTLMIYIEGDGVPWKKGKYPSDDPTPRDPLTLRLMAQDLNAAIYLGRPCYFGLNHTRNCSPDIWTSARYSQEVIASMIAVVRQYIERFGVSRLVLVGYSGGGAIATLMARSITVPTFVVTIAGNLDTDAWTASRGFLPLGDSLNPVDFIDQLREVPQLHLIALNDQTVSPFVTRSYTDHFPAKPTRSYSDIDHSCCWTELWPLILQESPWKN